MTVDWGVVVTLDSAGTEQGAGGRSEPPFRSPARRVAPGPSRDLLDRQAERAAIDRALGSVRDGFSATLVIQGDAGVGKTALLGYAADSAADMRVCGVTGIETEIALEFAALHQLLVPFLPGVDGLPDPQRLALRVAFGMERGPAADRFLVGLAALTLMARAADEEPVLCLVDDGQWLDVESAHALGFAARRLYADRVAVLIAVRGRAPGDAFGQLPAVRVGGLPPEAARKLLRSVTKGPVDDLVAARILDDTERNPLALVEVGAEFTAREMAGRAARPEPVPLGGRLTDRFARQAAGLDPDTQVFLLIVAADASGDRALLWRAARQGGIDPDAAADAAESAGLVELSAGSVRFRYPLIRSAVYHGAADRHRRRAHLLLSAAIEASRDPDLVAWHRGSAATGPDETVAAELDRAADRAQARGGYAARAALLRRSVQLTPDDRRRASRELKLGEAELRSGSKDTAQELVDAALPRVADPGARAHGVRLRGEILLAQGHAAESAHVLARAAQLLASGQDAARETLAAAMRAAIWAGSAQTKKIAAAAAAFPHSARSQASADLLLAGYAARYTTGYTAAITPLRAALKRLRSEDLEPVAGLLWYGMGAMAAGSLWDADSLLDIAGRFLRAARTLGAIAVLPVALEFRAVAECVAGRFAEAHDRWTEMREIMAASCGPQILSIDSRSEGLALVYTGRVDEARAVGTAQIQDSAALGQDGRADVGRAIIARAELCAGNYDAAVAAAATVAEHDLAFTAEATLPELIEAACRSDRRGEANAAFHILSERTQATGTPWALGVRARCEALLADGDRAEEAYLEAIRHLEHSHAAVDLARAHLHYGQWQRRAKRRRDARRELRTAYDMFDAMGAEGFAASAAAELRATGEPALPRTQASVPRLTPQEARVAGMAAEGVTTNQIAAQLFISPRTVDYHLGKVFRTLGISSRGQLARHLTVGGAPAGR